MQRLIPTLALAAGAFVANGQPTPFDLAGGRLTNQDGLAIIAGDIQPAPNATSLSLPPDLGHLNRAQTTIDRQVHLLEFVIDPETSKLTLQLPKTPRPLGKIPLRLETGATTQQFRNGRILLSAGDANVVGSTAKLESNPGNLRIGFWTNPEDTVHWNYPATRPGRYRAHLTYSKAGRTETPIQLKAAQSLAHHTLQPTGSWYTYRTVDLGPVYIPKSGDIPIRVSAQYPNETRDAVMNLKALTLVPTSEGEAVYQSVDDSVTLHARDVTIQGIKVQYERLPHKNTVGYWIHVEDWAYWDFTVNRPGRFAVEILQGCGKGHGGSDVLLEVGSNQLLFQVEDTGHFQNFVPRYIGEISLPRPDQYRLAIKPQKKAAGAVMDLRRIRLVPVAKQR